MSNKAQFYLDIVHKCLSVTNADKRAETAAIAYPDIRLCTLHNCLAESSKCRSEHEYDETCKECVRGVPIQSVLFSTKAILSKNIGERREEWKKVLSEKPQNKQLTSTISNADNARYDAMIKWSAEERAAWLAYAAEATILGSRVHEFNQQIKRASTHVNEDMKTDDDDESTMDTQQFDHPTESRRKVLVQQLKQFVDDCGVRNEKKGSASGWCSDHEAFGDAVPWRDHHRYESCGVCVKPRNKTEADDKDAMAVAVDSSLIISRPVFRSSSSARAST